MSQNYIVKAYSLEPVHIATVKQVAKDHGESGESAALRFIIDRFVEYEKRLGGNGHQFTPDQMAAIP